MKYFEIEKRRFRRNAGTPNWNATREHYSYNEESNCSWSFRFVSLYNGARGIWRKSKAEAEKDGHNHTRLICSHHKIGDER